MLLRSVLTSSASRDPTTEGESELLMSLEQDTAIQMLALDRAVPHASTDGRESEGQQQQLARDTLGLGQLLSASTLGVARQRTTGDWGLGGDHQLSIMAAYGNRRGGERMIALTSPSPVAESAEVVLAVQHTHRTITTASTS